MFGKTSDDGYKLIEGLEQIPELKSVPKVVISYAINQSDMGLREKEKALNSGFKVAYGKIPDFPPLEQLLIHARPNQGIMQ